MNSSWKVLSVLLLLLLLLVLLFVLDWGPDIQTLEMYERGSLGSDHLYALIRRSWAVEP